MPAPLKFKSGDAVDRYVIEDVIGRGGMGTVYSAYDSRLHRRVALKVLLAASEDEPPDLYGTSSPGTNAAARMLREARAAASFDHPNAVHVFDVGEVEGNPYIAMELILGQSLSTLVNDAQFGWPTRLRWLVDAGRALGAAHRAGLIHRDVKPDNVMVRNDGVAKVLDFGIVRHAHALNPMGATAPHGFPSLTQRGAVLGTPHYMAPEQIRGLTLDARADQFSWGVMAFELLTKTMPWGTGLEAISLALTSPAPSLQVGCPELPDAVNAAIMRTLAKIPGERFPTMEELALAIEPFAAAPVNAGDASGPVVAINFAAARLPTTGGGHATPLVQKKKKDGVSPAWLYAGALALALGVGGIYAVMRTPEAASSPPVPSAPPPATMTDVPRPASVKPDAFAAYLTGLQAIRDGSRDVAIDNFARAVALDPSMGAAHLRLAIFEYVMVPAAARQEFEKAQGLRSALTEHDQALLAAMEPVLQRQPSDWEAAKTRLTAALQKFPNDTEMQFHLAAAYLVTDPAGAGPTLDAAIATDPKFAFAWALKSEALAYQGDFQRATAGLTECLAISPTAAGCLARQVDLAELRGDAAAKERDSRRMTTVNAGASAGYFNLAQTLLAEGRPVEAVSEVIKQGWTRISDPEERQRTKLRYEINLDLWTGDFTKAEQQTHELDRASESSLSEEDHAFVARRLVDIYSETGRTAEAGQVAVAFFKKREAWVAYPMAEDWSISADAAPTLLEAELRAGLLTPAAFESARSAWVTGWKAKASPFYVHYLWVHGYAAIAQTPAEGKDALAQLTQLGPIPPFRPITQSDAYIGRTFLLAGDTEKAVTYLTVATRAGRALEFPVESSRAYHSLGLALEASGDAAGACAAYAPLLQRWGSSKSLTAAKARARALALSCKL